MAVDAEADAADTYVTADVLRRRDKLRTRRFRECFLPTRDQVHCVSSPPTTKKKSKNYRTHAHVYGDYLYVIMYACFCFFVCFPTMHTQRIHFDPIRSKNSLPLLGDIKSVLHLYIYRKLKPRPGVTCLLIAAHRAGPRLRIHPGVHRGRDKQHILRASSRAVHPNYHRHPLRGDQHERHNLLGHTSHIRQVRCRLPNKNP